MNMMNTGDILETIEMFTQDNLDVRTVTMGISLLDCIDPDGKKACEKIYNKITRLAGNLVPVVNKISADYGIPIVNKRISVTPIAMLLGAAPDADPVWFAKTLDAAAKAVGVNFIGGYSALVQKGFSKGDELLLRSIPQALAQTELVCSSVNVGSTKAGINMDAVARMGRIIKETAHLLLDALDVMVNRLDGHHFAHVGLAGRVADHRRAAAHQRNRAMPRALHVRHRHNRDVMPDVEGISGRIEADVEGGRFFELLVQFVLKGGLGDEAALFQNVKNVHGEPPIY